MAGGKLAELGGKTLEELVLDSSGKVVLDTDGSPFFTSVSHRLQAKNQITLAKMVKEAMTEHEFELTGGEILEPGSGEGILNALKWDMLFPITGPRDLLSFDLSTEKITKYRRIQEYLSRYWAEQRGVKKYELPKTLIADPLDIVEMSPRFVYVNKRYHELSPAAMIWCSSMFHWVRDLDSKIQVMEKFYDMLKPGGVFAFNMSTQGTAEEFLEAYKEVMERLEVYHKRNNTGGYKRIKLKEDPIGSMPFLAMRNLIKDSGFGVLKSDVKVETAYYHDPEEYAESVRIYGKGKFLEPVSHLTSTQQDEIWGMIVKRHTEIAKRNGWKPGQVYEYEQVNMYVIAQKPYDDISAEIFRPSLKKSKLAPIDSVLNETYVGFALGSIKKGAVKKEILPEATPSLEFTVSGNFEMIKGKGAPISVNDIMIAIFDHATLNWLYFDSDNKVVVDYSVLGSDRLSLNFEVYLKEDVPIDKLLRAGMVTKLRENEVSMYSRKLESGRTRYEFNIPIGTLPQKEAKSTSSP